MYKAPCEDDNNNIDDNNDFFSHTCFVSRTFTFHMTSGEEVGHLFYSSLHRHLDISRTITAENASLHIDSSRIQTGDLWFPSASR